MKLLFDFRTKGHHIEYIHHIYMMMARSTENYVMVVPDDYKKRGKEYEWPDSKNIYIDLIPKEKAESTETGNLIQQSYKKTKLLKNYVQKYHPSNVFLISLISYIPFLPFMIPHKVNVTGILYKIYLYEWKRYSAVRKLLECFKYKCMTADNCLNHIMVLNDNSAAIKLNRIYKTDKFIFLPDPFNKISYTARNIRKELGIPKSNRVFLHFGSMNRRKGTLSILKAIKLLPKENANDITVVIAGLIREDIKKEVYLLLSEIENTACQILLYDKFCSNEFIADLCCSSDFILMPYQAVAQSSGLIAYAANYHIPVIGPSEGLVGKLIRKNKLGIHLDNIDEFGIADVMANVQPYKINSVYSVVSSIDSFQDKINKVF